MGIFLEKNGQYMTRPIQATFVRLDSPDQSGKFALTARISKKDEDTVKGFRECISAYMKEHLPPSFKLAYANQPVKDGDLEGNPKYENCFYINFKSQYPVTAVDVNNKAIDIAQVKRGDEVRVFFNIYKWDYQGKEGLSFGLGNIKVTKSASDEVASSFGGGSRSAEADFADVEEKDLDSQYFDTGTPAGDSEPAMGAPPADPGMDGDDGVPF